MKLLLLAASSLAQDTAPQCVQCQWAMDITTGEEYKDGLGGSLLASPDCFNPEKSGEFVGDCARGLVGRSFCFNEAIIEWRPSGEQIIKLTRGCRTAEWEDRCEPASDGGYQRTDCHVTVENTDSKEPTNQDNLDDLWALVNVDQDEVTECNACYAEGVLINGEEIGNEGEVEAFEQTQE